MRFLLLFAMVVSAQNWPTFRGPGARGVAEKQNLPVSWDVASGKNIAWKTEIPGLGLSSPIVWGSHVFLTTAVSSNPNMVFEATLKGELDRRQDEAVQEFRVLALDKKTGKVAWNVVAGKTKPRVLRHPHNSYASPTPVTDGKYLVAFFGSEGLFCFDLKGKLIWKKDLGAMDQGAFDLPDYQWGSAASPVLWQGKVYLQVDMHQGSFMAAFDAATGRELWRTARDSKPSWATPTIVEGPKRTELVANGVEFVAGYDAETGKELWRVKGTSMISVPTPFVANGLIYVFSGYSRNIRRSYAIRPGAMGDITGSKEAIAWMRRRRINSSCATTRWSSTSRTCCGGRTPATSMRSSSRRCLLPRRTPAKGFGAPISSPTPAQRSSARLKWRRASGRGSTLMRVESTTSARSP